MEESCETATLRRQEKGACKKESKEVIYAATSQRSPAPFGHQSRGQPLPSAMDSYISGFLFVPPSHRKPRSTTKKTCENNFRCQWEKHPTKLNVSLSLSFSYKQHMLDEIICSLRSDLVIAKKLIDIGSRKQDLET